MPGTHTTAWFLPGLVPRILGTPPSVSYRPLAQATRVRNMSYGGQGRVAGTIKVKGTPDYPTHRRVRLILERTGALVAETWSDPVTGAYEFIDVDPTQLYTVLAYDYTHTFRCAVADAVVPAAYP
jgi:hypothetical protein